jgi:hypothetical protein
MKKLLLLVISMVLVMGVPMANASGNTTGKGWSDSKGSVASSISDSKVVYRHRKHKRK